MTNDQSLAPWDPHSKASSVSKSNVIIRKLNVPDKKPNIQSDPKAQELNVTPKFSTQKQNKLGAGKGQKPPAAKKNKSPANKPPLGVKAKKTEPREPEVIKEKVKESNKDKKVQKPKDEKPKKGPPAKAGKSQEKKDKK